MLNVKAYSLKSLIGYSLSKCARRMISTTITTSIDEDGFATVTLNRPNIHNAFSDKMIAELQASFDELSQNSELRGVFLRASGKSFCAGADLEWMKRTTSYTRDENLKDAVNLSTMLKTLNCLPHPTIALVQGAAFGGGVGCVSACDIAIGVERSIFSLSEVKLGLIPATIAPYVIQAIGQRAARRYFLTAERFTAAEAYDIGLLHKVVNDEVELDKAAIQMKNVLLKNAPGAVRNSKLLIEYVSKNLSLTDDLIMGTASRLCDQRLTDECSEGLSAFFSKENPSWVPKK